MSHENLLQFQSWTTFYSPLNFRMNNRNEGKHLIDSHRFREDDIFDAFRDTFGLFASIGSPKIIRSIPINSFDVQCAHIIIWFQCARARALYGVEIAHTLSSYPSSSIQYITQRTHAMYVLVNALLLSSFHFRFSSTLVACTVYLRSSALALWMHCVWCGSNAKYESSARGAATWLISCKLQLHEFISLSINYNLL